MIELTPEQPTVGTYRIFYVMTALCVLAHK